MEIETEISGDQNLKIVEFAKTTNNNHRWYFCPFLNQADLSKVYSLKCFSHNKNSGVNWISKFIGFACGGETESGNCSNTFFSFDISTGKVKEFPSLLNPRSSFGFLYLNDMIYVIGGRDKVILNNKLRSNFLRDCEVFNFTSHTWESFESLPDNLISMDCFMSENLLCVFGIKEDKTFVVNSFKEGKWSSIIRTTRKERMSQLTVFLYITRRRAIDWFVSPV